MLNNSHIHALKSVDGGATVHSELIAKALIEVEQHQPDLLTLAGSRKNMQYAYTFYAETTKKGQEFLATLDAFGGDYVKAN